MSEGGSSVPRRQVGRLLRQAREAAGVPVETAVRTIEVGRNKLYRMENGEAPVRLIEAEKLCSLYRVTPELTEVIIALSGETKAKAGGTPTATPYPPGSSCTSAWRGRPAASASSSPS